MFGEKRYSVAEVAEMYGVANYTIRHHIRIGHINAIKLGQRLVIRERDIEEFERDYNTKNLRSAKRQ